MGIIAACLLVRVCEVCVVVWFQLEAVVCRLEEQGEDGVDSGSLLELKNTLQELITVSEGVHMYMCVCCVCSCCACKGGWCETRSMLQGQVVVLGMGSLH